MPAQPVEILFAHTHTPFGNVEPLWNDLCSGTAKPLHRLTKLPFEDEMAAQFEASMLRWGFNERRKEASVQSNRRAQQLRTFFATTKGLPERSVVQPLSAAAMDDDVTVVSNACVSGSQALIEGVESLEDGDCGIAVVLGGDAISQFIEAGFTSLQAKTSGVARPFDHRREGLTLGSAGAVVWLRSVEENSHFPRIISYGCSNDANHISGPSQDGSGLALAIERALEGIDKSEIRAICAHGTATVYNDAMEARAFHTVFNGNPPPVFGIKGAIGHTLGAAGLIEVIVSAKVATEGLIPPTVGFEQGEDEYPLDIVHGEPRRIEPGYVLTTNSGFGGMNTAIVVGPGAA